MVSPMPTADLKSVCTSLSARARKGGGLDRPAAGRGVPTKTPALPFEREVRRTVSWRPEVGRVREILM